MINRPLNDSGLGHGKGRIILFFAKESRGNAQVAIGRSRKGGQTDRQTDRHNLNHPSPHNNLKEPSAA